MTTTQRFPTTHPAAKFIRIADTIRVLEPRHQAWALVLLTTPIPHHALGWADVIEVDADDRVVTYTVGHGADRQQHTFALSQTAQRILLPGSGPLLDLMGAGQSNGYSMLQELGHALRDAAEPDTIDLATIYEVAFCLSRQTALEGPGAAPAAESLIQQAGFA